MYTFAFLCTDTSSYESAIGKDNLNAIIITISALVCLAILAVPFLLSRKYWDKAATSRRLVLVISWMVAIPLSIVAGLSSWFFLGIATC
jgi:nitrogen fixation/metabolism regulation signal transduction histidine kinase